MKWSKLNNENKQKYIVNVKRRYEIIEGLSIKLSKQFIRFIEGVIENIKKYKKIYKKLVSYLALCMFLYTIPNIISIIESFDYAEFMLQIKNTPRDTLIKSILDTIRSIACYTTLILVSIDVIKISLKKS